MKQMQRVGRANPLPKSRKSMSEGLMVLGAVSAIALGGCADRAMRPEPEVPKSDMILVSKVAGPQPKTDCIEKTNLQVWLISIKIAIGACSGASDLTSCILEKSPKDVEIHPSESQLEHISQKVTMGSVLKKIDGMGEFLVLAEQKIVVVGIDANGVDFEESTHFYANPAVDYDSMGLKPENADGIVKHSFRVNFDGSRNGEAGIFREHMWYDFKVVKKQDASVHVEYKRPRYCEE